MCKETYFPVRNWDLDFMPLTCGRDRGFEFCWYITCAHVCRLTTKWAQGAATRPYTIGDTADSAALSPRSRYLAVSRQWLRQRVVEPEYQYVEALGVLVVSAARHRSWEPSSPNAAALTTLGLWSLEGVLHPHTPLPRPDLTWAGKNCPTGTKFPERRKLDREKAGKRLHWELSPTKGVIG